MDGFVAIDGQTPIPAKDAKVSVFDRGLLFGDCVFEVLVAFGNKIIDLDAHLDRLYRSATKVALTLPWTKAALAQELQDITTKVGGAKTYLRLVVSRGDGLGLGIATDQTPRRILYALPAKVEPRTLYTTGVSLKLTLSQQNQTGAHAKTGNYLPAIIGIEKAKEAGFDDILWHNQNEEILEASTANVFLMGRWGDQVEIATPPEQTGLLGGITRQRIINLLEQVQIPVTVRPIHCSEIARFDEGFLSSSVRGLVPIQRINQHRLHTCRDQAVFRHISRLYDTWLEAQLGRRVDWNTGEKQELLHS